MFAYFTENCFHVVTSDAEEKYGLNKSDTKYAGENVWKYAVDTARLKAEDVFNRATQNTIPNLNETFMVIGSDTIVTYGGTIYGKPKDKEDAIRVLKELSGKTHSVISGVVILLNHTKNGTIQSQIEHQFHSVTKVQFDIYRMSKVVLVLPMLYLTNCSKSTTLKFSNIFV